MPSGSDRALLAKLDQRFDQLEKRFDKLEQLYSRPTIEPPVIVRAMQQMEEASRDLKTLVAEVRSKQDE